ncbi:hypothetical protein DBR32_07735 [Taibaiella sp. KBW10]|uniref:hypothetical protein n=1 Tax=Taibaiella sp. KBW10 TaxID=2153357 RepID=UPI000F5AC053|nr:hypothetical protein [Taibaiella sp. KBW10]RQO30617.1 hypothetical protein DBR32_07735 [Taibaiella sp. KBW10]
MEDYLEEKKQAFVGQIGFRKKLFLLLILLIAFIGPAVVLVVTIRATNNLGRTLLGQARYAERMMDSYQYAAVTFALCLLIMIPFALVLLHFCKRYIPVIRTLNDADMEALHIQNEQTFIFNKYLPTYIFHGDTVTFFKLLSALSIPIHNIKTVKRISSISRSPGQHIRIGTLSSNHTLVITGNNYEYSNLMLRLYEKNPQIIFDNSF